MKMIIVTNLSLGFLLAAAASSAFGQGTITFNTFNGANTALGQVFLPDGVTGPGSDYVGQLYWSDASDGTFIAVGTPEAFSASDSGVAQYIMDGSVPIPGRSAGTLLFFKLYVWNIAAGGSYEAALGSPSLRASGVSQAKSRVLGGADSDGNLFTSQHFNHFPNFALSAAAPAQPTLSSTLSSNNLVLRWSAPFVLQSAASVNGVFSDVSGASSPYTNTTTSPAQKFFRLRN